MEKESHPSVTHPEEWKFHCAVLSTRQVLVSIAVRVFRKSQQKKQDTSYFVKMVEYHWKNPTARCSFYFMADEGHKRAFYQFYDQFCQDEFMQNLFLFAWKKANPPEVNRMTEVIREYLQLYIEKQRKMGLLEESYHAKPQSRPKPYPKRARKEEEDERPMKKRIIK